MSEAYNCVTVEDVWRRAYEQRAWRKKWFDPPKQQNPENMPLNILIAAAYPAQYPLTVTPEAPPRIEQIIDRVCAVFRCNKQDVVSERRTHDIMIPRHVCMALAKRLTRNSLPQIGLKIGRRDHTTILSAVRKMKPIIDAVDAETGGVATLDRWVELCKHYVESGLIKT